MAITMTEKAATEIKRIFRENGMPEGSCLRVGVKGGGCSGFSYTLDVSTQPAGDDEVFETNGVKLLCDPKSYLWLAGTEIDFESKIIGSQFVFNNPNAKGKCGCGASFRA